MVHVVLSVNRNETSDYLAANCFTVSMIVPRHVLKGDCDTLVSCKDISFTNMLHQCLRDANLLGKNQTLKD